MVSKKKLIFSKTISPFAESLRDFLKTCDKTSKGVQNALPKSIIETGSTTLKTTSLLITWKISLNIQTGILVYFSDPETTNLAFSLAKSWNYSIISSYLQKLSTSTIDNLPPLQEPLLRCWQVWNDWEQLRSYALTRDCRYDNSIVKAVGNVFCPNAMCSERLCLQKNFNLWVEATSNVLSALPRVRCVTFP